MFPAYISRHFFPVVEASDWLSSCSLERADWFHPARCPSLICTHRVQATSRLLLTVLMLIGYLSSWFMKTIGAMTRHSNGRWRLHFSHFIHLEIVLLFSLQIIPPHELDWHSFTCCCCFKMCNCVDSVLASWIDDDSLQWVRNVQTLCNMRVNSLVARYVDCLDVESLNAHTYGLIVALDIHLKMQIGYNNLTMGTLLPTVSVVTFWSQMNLIILYTAGQASYSQHQTKPHSMNSLQSLILKVYIGQG